MSWLIPFYLANNLAFISGAIYFYPKINLTVLFNCLNTIDTCLDQSNTNLSFCFYTLTFLSCSGQIRPISISINHKYCVLHLFVSRAYDILHTRHLNIYNCWWLLSLNFELFSQLCNRLWCSRSRMTAIWNELVTLDCVHPSDSTQPQIHHRHHTRTHTHTHTHTPPHVNPFQTEQLGVLSFPGLCAYPPTLTTRSRLNV